MSPRRITISLLLVIPATLCVAGIVFLHESKAKLRGPCKESAPRPELVGLPPTEPGTATPVTPPPAAGEPPPFAEPPIQRTAGPGEAELVKLALRYEPELKVAKADRFWPVPVPAVLALAMGDRRTRFVAGGEERDVSLADLRAPGNKNEYLDYPAEIEHVQDEFCSAGRALGIAAVDLARWSTYPDLLHPERTAQFYFLPRDVEGGEDLQYWFFYPYNYLPLVTLNPFFMSDPIAATLFAADFHEGDFEHVTVRLRRAAGGRLEPVEIEMARHSSENKTLPWDSPTRLKRAATHPIVYAGFGGHASYEGCGRQVRHVAPLIRLLDWSLCDEEKIFTLGYDTPLVDLRSASWACWPGHFGEVPSMPISNLRVAGPPGPFFQAGNDAKALCGEGLRPAATG